ncbi:hypothetical protein [Anaerosinus massiliensis]|uniref:hypothetical protein n=1 Tax=Massilibacillus massiliensis TaxID=1806837 RepID=UPI000DA5FBF9|nr:hypothetical protein [Massilibacillus massiliensis]
MIKVKTLECFDKFVEIAKANGVLYQVIGSERDESSSVEVFTEDKPKPVKFKLNYVLFCSLFNVYLEKSVKINEKTSLLEKVKKYDVEKFNQITFKNETIECE